MRTVGLIGGMSWISTALYYRALNEGVSAALGGFHSAPVVVWSIDFEEVQRAQRSGDDAAEVRLLVDAARALEAAGAGCVLICSNTMHRLAERVEEAIEIPLLHIADAIGAALTAAGHRRAGLAGTRLVLDGGFIAERLRTRFDVELVLPPAADRRRLQSVIEQEFDADRVSPAARSAVDAVLAGLVTQGADALVLACTSLGRIADTASLPVPAYDSALLHAQAALDWCLDRTAVAD